MSKKTPKAKYEVTIKRTIEYVATLDITARSPEEAQEIGEREADAPRSDHWREGDVVSQDVKVKEIP